MIYSAIYEGVVDHHRLLKEAFEEDGLAIPDLDLPATGDRPISIFLSLVVGTSPRSKCSRRPMRSAVGWRAVFV